jgi:hypothetical protein
VIDARLLEPPKGKKQAYWFEVCREEPDAWQPLAIDGRTWFKVGDVPTPEQVVLADVAERAASARYRIEWKQRNRNNARCGFSPPFLVEHVPAVITPPPAPVVPAEPEPEPDEDEDDETDEGEDEEGGEDELPAQNAPQAPPNGARKPRRDPRANGHANGHPGAHVGGLTPVPSAWPVLPPMPPEYQAAAAQSAAMMFPFQAFDYLKRSADADAERAEKERERRDQRDREFTAGMIATVQSQAEQSAKTMQSFFERSLRTERERRVEAETRAAAQQGAAATAGASQGEELVKVMVEQFAQMRLAMEALKPQLDAGGDNFDFEGLAKAAGGLMRMVSNIPGVKKHVPELADFFAPSAAAGG